jgi:tetratricopeptide (TPR) repeat protein
LDPASFPAHSYLYDVYTENGKYPEAVEIFFNSEKLTVNHSTLPSHLDQLKAAFESGGIRAFWQKRVETIQGDEDAGGFAVAKYYARLGKNDEALKALKQAHDARDFGFPFFYSDPVFVQCCSSDPRFRELHELWARPKD